MDVASVVIVNYNGARFLRDCLESLRRQNLPRHRFEIIVVDNGSRDDSIRLMREEFPWVRLIRAGKNLGFAAGNNLGIRLARGSAIALINNDTKADPAWLGELVAELSHNPNAGMAASKLLFDAEPGRLNSGGLDLLADGHGQDRGFRDIDCGHHEKGREVFGGCGAGLAIRREMLEDIGTFDERFFMYYEDVDLAWRARHRGWDVLYCPRSVVRHIHCGSSGEWSPFFTYYVERNRALASFKNADGVLALRVFLSLLTRFRKAINARLRGGSGAILAAYFRAVLMVFALLPAIVCDRHRIRTQPSRARGN